MLNSPSHVVIGAADPKATGAVFEALGFETVSSNTLPTEAALALYGLRRPLEERILVADGAATGWIRIVETDVPAPRSSPYDFGPSLLDFYARDIETTLETMKRLGTDSHYVSHYPVEGLGDITELRVTGPHDLFLGIVSPPGPRPNRLMEANGHQHSEVHAFCTILDSIDVALPFWASEAKLEKLIDFTLEDSEISKLFDLPHPVVRFRVVHLASQDARPVRFLLLEFLEQKGHQLPSLPLARGLHCACFTVENVHDAINSLQGARFGDVVEFNGTNGGRRCAATGVAPGGTRIELWSEPT